MTSTIEAYYNLTKLDIKTFFNDFITFVQNYYPLIVGFYTDDRTQITSEPFLKFDELNKMSKKISDSFKNFGSQFNNLEYWELLDNFDNVNCKLKTIKNTPKWAKSNKLWGYTQNNNIEQYALEQLETIEALANKVGYSDKENDWADIALNNDMWEETYTSEGAEKMLSITFQNMQSFGVNTVIGSIIGTQIYGLDIQKKIEFIDNDLKVLDYRDTLLQSIEIRMSLTKGSIPEFPNLGISKDLAGTNLSSFKYGTAFREILSMFENDGRFKSVTLVDIKKDQDSIFLEFQIETRLGDVIKQSLSV